MLVDVVSSSQFITERKSRALIGKIIKLASEHDAKKLNRETKITERVKSMNESIFYNVDEIYDAMSENVMITFELIWWKSKHKTYYRKDKKRYKVSPWRLYYEDEHYYMIAYDNDDEKIKYFRVDKMNKIEKCKDKRNGKNAFTTHMGNDFSHRNFHMFSGRRESITLEAESGIMGVMIDKFGEDVFMREEAGRYIIHTQVDISSQFYGWLLGLEGKVKIVGPGSEIAAFKKYVKDIMDSY